MLAILQIMEGKTLSEMSVMDWLYTIVMLPVIAVFVIVVLAVLALVFIGPLALLKSGAKEAGIIAAVIGTLTAISAVREKPDEPQPSESKTDDEQEKA